MRLDEVTQGINGRIIQNGEFETLEYCTSTMNKKILSFMENPKFLNNINPNITCMLCKEDLVEKLPLSVLGVFITDYPKKAFHQIHNQLSTNENYCLKQFANQIGENCQISPNAHIACQNVKIGNNVIIEDNAVINGHCIIGDNSMIHSGAMIGSKAFTFAKTAESGILGLIDAGQVIIGKNVEIFPNVHIAKGVLPTDTTYLDDEVKIDALSYIGHGVSIGKRTLIAAGVSIGGNSKIGNDCWVGINATISNRISIGNFARVSLGAVVTKNVPDGLTVSGNFAINHEMFLDHLKQSINTGVK